MLCLQRSLPVTDVDGRTLHGKALTFNRAYRVSDDGQNWYREGWRRGAFDRSIQHRRNTFELRDVHRDVRVGLVSFEAVAEDFVFRAPLDDGDEGDRVLARVNAGEMRGVSIGFRPQSAQRDHSQVLWRYRAEIRELSMTTRGQYEDAQVSHVRSADWLANALQLLADSDNLLQYSDLEAHP